MNQHALREQAVSSRGTAVRIGAGTVRCFAAQKGGSSGLLLAGRGEVARRGPAQHTSRSHFRRARMRSCWARQASMLALCPSRQCPPSASPLTFPPVADGTYASRQSGCFLCRYRPVCCSWHGLAVAFLPDIPHTMFVVIIVLADI